MKTTRKKSSAKQKERVLITGGLGFIFSHVSEYLAAKGYEIHIIDDLSAGSHPELIGTFPFTFYNADSGSRFAESIVKKVDPHYIIHAAAISDVDTSIKNPLGTIERNNMANLTMFEAARHCPSLKKFVYISTDEVYGECEVKKTETDIVWPRNPYSLSKAFGTLLRITYDNTFDELKFKTAETRFCNIFGPRQDERKILGALKKSLKTGSTIKIHNGGSGYREYMYVKNIPPIMEKIMLDGSRIYNITDNDGFTVNELIARVEKVIGKKFKVERGHRAGMDMKYQMDSTRVREEFGFKSEYSFDQSIKEYFSDSVQ
ncbi:MAG: hypothetical protein RLZZ67_170 [Candidatus Parcubacteria bacterium]|jgi:dTDP-glucose 4,6-dehydratase